MDRWWYGHLQWFHYFLHFDLSEIIAFARYLPITPPLPVTSETCPLPLDHSICDCLAMCIWLVLPSDLFPFLYTQKLFRCLGTFFTVNKYAENFPYISPRRRKLYLTLNYTYINIYFHSITIKHFWPRTFQIQIILSQLANIKEPSWWQMRY